MKAKVISEMMHDDQFDPSIWALDAISNYATQHPEVLLEDPFNREYLFRAMDSSDVEKIAAKIVQVFSTNSPIREKVSIEFLEAMPKTWGADYYVRNAIERIWEHAIDKKPIIQKIVEIKNLNFRPDQYLIHADNFEIKKALQNWSNSNWKTTTIRIVADRLSSDEIFEYKDLIFSKLDRYGYYGIARLIQSDLIYLTDQLPDSYGKKWYNWLRTKTMDNVYLTESIADHFKAPSRIGVGFSTLLCHCGRFAKSKSGLKNHQNHCDYGNKPNILTYAKIKMARANPDLLICQTCGMQCKTKSGLTLHQKGHNNEQRDCS